MIKLTNFVFRSAICPGHRTMYCLSEMCERLNRKYKASCKLVGQILVLKQPDFTLMVFKSGKMRIMGGVIQTRKAAKRIFTRWVLKRALKHQRHALKLDKVRIQTITATFDYGVPIHLQKLCNYIQGLYPLPRDRMPTWLNFYEPEIFPALQLKICGSIHCNIFATGKAVLTGLKHYDEACVIIERIKEYLNVYK